MRPRSVRLDRFTSGTNFATGSCHDVEPAPDGLVMLPHVESASWTSAEVTPGFPVANLVPSFTAQTPGASWIEVHARLGLSDGTKTGWYAFGRWAETDAAITRTSAPGQRDPSAHVETDVLVADAPAVTWQLRVTLHRTPRDSGASPVVRSVNAVATGPAAESPDASGPEASSPGRLTGIVLDVPQFSQRLHRGRYPQWGGGGASWCSPTSVAMLTAYWGASPADLSWVDPGPEPRVVHAARGTYDDAYGGCGNWPFNTAYAGTFGLDAYVTRLNSLAETELYIEAGIPLVLSAGYKAGQVPGADYDTSGHLLVLAGFAADGNPVMNDPAADTNESVRKTFGRAEFERAWQSTSGGIAYVIHPPAWRPR